LTTNDNIRNIAIIAHVDHGKTTLVDELLKQGGVWRENQVVEERVMDNNALERERGITILAKNASVRYKGVKINIVDTPGHADFGGEVERALKMVNGVLLLVDAAEGPMPQTRFVLTKALELGHKVIVVINKVDRPDARPLKAADEVLELLMDLGASDEQLDSPIIYCSGRSGTASLTWDGQAKDLAALFEAILSHIPAPKRDDDGALQLLVSSLDYSDYVGRLATGRVERGVLRAGQEVMVCDYSGRVAPYRAKVVNVYRIEGLKRIPAESVSSGDIVCFSGIESVNIGQTVTSADAPEPLPFVNISEPTVEMTFSVNDSPFAGREGRFVTSRQLRDRLYKELLRDVSLRVSDGETTESFRVAGRGEMHLSILIETMRREGYEFAVSTPRVLMREENGQLMEPAERIVIDVPEQFMGAVMEEMGARRGELVQMSPAGGRMRLVYVIPARGLLGYRNEFMTDTRGEGVLNSIFEGYVPYKGEIVRRYTGSLIAHETGEAVTYGLYNAQERGVLFIGPGTPVYEGMVVGMSPKKEDIVVNVCRRKHMTNIRAAGSDDALRLIPPKRLSLEEALEFLAEDELLEVTPKSMRLRKRILSNAMRLKERGGQRA